MSNLPPLIQIICILMAMLLIGEFVFAISIIVYFYIEDLIKGGGDE